MRPVPVRSQTRPQTARPGAQEPRIPFLSVLGAGEGHTERLEKGQLGLPHILRPAIS